MDKNTFTKDEKREIAKKIKDISLADADEDFDKLSAIGSAAHTIGERSQIGNNVVDYFTFVERLDTKGKYNANYFDFVENIEEFKKKKFIQNMLKYYAEVKNKNNTKHQFKVYKEVYNICISAINILRPLNCMEIYTKYKAKRVLDFCSGWGGSGVAAAALKLDAYYGTDINIDLQQPYDNMVSYLKTKSATNVQFFIGDGTQFDYSKLKYDTVFTSPPYYFIQKYANNAKYVSKKEMDEKFYKPIFTNTYNSLQLGGYYIINVCKEVYENVLKELFGEAHEIFPMKKSKRQNDYNEIVYVWRKANA